eukprot:4317224-Pleurochrysis_carterae.AAC.5
MSDADPLAAMPLAAVLAMRTEADMPPVAHVDGRSLGTRDILSREMEYEVHSVKHEYFMFNQPDHCDSRLTATLDTDRDDW